MIQKRIILLLKSKFVNWFDQLWRDTRVIGVIVVRNYHNLDVGLNYSDDTWMFNASLGMTPQKRAIERKMGKLYADTTMHTIDFQPMIWVN